MRARVLETGGVGREQMLSPHYRTQRFSKWKIKNSSASMPYGGTEVNIGRHELRDLKIPKHLKPTSGGSEEKAVGWVRPSRRACTKWHISLRVQTRAS